MMLPRRRFLRLGLAAATGAAVVPVVARRGAGAGLPGAAGANPRRLCAGGRGRHHREARGAIALRAAWPALHRRKPARRRHQYCDRSGREVAAGRLYAGDAQSALRHQCDALREAQLQRHPRSRPDRERDQDAVRAGGQSGGSGEDGPGAHRPRQSQSGQDHHGVERQRLGASSVRRAVQDDGRRRPRPRALPRRGARHHRSDLRPGAADVRHHCGLERAHQGGESAGARVDHRDGGGDRPPGDERVPARLRIRASGPASPPPEAPRPR